jgi:hypothetical protein
LTYSSGYKNDQEEQATTEIQSKSNFENNIEKLKEEEKALKNQCENINQQWKLIYESKLNEQENEIKGLKNSILNEREIHQQKIKQMEAYYHDLILTKDLDHAEEKHGLLIQLSQDQVEIVTHRYDETMENSIFYLENIWSEKKLMEENEVQKILLEEKEKQVDKLNLKLENLSPIKTLIEQDDAQETNIFLFDKNEEIEDLKYKIKKLEKLLSENNGSANPLLTEEKQKDQILLDKKEFEIFKLNQYITKIEDDKKKETLKLKQDIQTIENEKENKILNLNQQTEIIEKENEKEILKLNKHLQGVEEEKEKEIVKLNQHIQHIEDEKEKEILKLSEQIKIYENENKLLNEKNTNKMLKLTQNENFKKLIQKHDEKMNTKEKEICDLKYGFEKLVEKHDQALDEKETKLSDLKSKFEKRLNFVYKIFKRHEIF